MGERFNVGSVYMDADGCFMLCVREDGGFMAFGNPHIIELENVAVAHPVIEAVTNSGELLIDRVPYPNSSNIKEQA